MRWLPLFHYDEIGVGCSCGTDPTRRRDKGIISIHDSPFSKLKSVDLGSVRWTEGFLGTRFTQLKMVTLPYLYELMADPNMGHALTNLRIAAGLEEGQFEGTH
ncbi:MAG: glycoside hydrolase family protein, partial [Paenibacillaceae bacterium]|nr:glycoside hydrolase family protein [Paenibacillaceae bacterium]